MTRRVYIHIGDPKTGTTSLQALLDANRSVLRKKGYIYATAGREVPHAMAHHALPRSIWRGENVTNLDALKPWQDLRREIETSPQNAIFIISSEGFSSLSSDEHAAAIASFFTGMDVRVLLAVRPPTEWAESMYAQNVMYPPYTASSFETYQGRVALKGFHAALHLAKFIDVERFTILPYGSDIVRNMVDALGVSDIINPELLDARKNTRAPAELLSAIYYLNRVRMPMQTRMALYTTMQSACDGLESFKILKDKDRDVQFKFSPEERRQFMARHKDVIQKFCEKFSFDVKDIFGRKSQ